MQGSGLVEAFTGDRGAVGMIGKLDMVISSYDM